MVGLEEDNTLHIIRNTAAIQITIKCRMGTILEVTTLGDGLAQEVEELDPTKNIFEIHVMPVSIPMEGVVHRSSIIQEVTKTESIIQSIQGEALSLAMQTTTGE